MSEKIEVEFKFKIGDQVKWHGVTSTSYVIARMCVEGEVPPKQRIEYQIQYRDKLASVDESELTLVEPPLTIKEVLEMARVVPSRTFSTGCPTCDLITQIIKRGIVP